MQKSPLVLPHRQYNSTRLTRLRNKRRHSSSVPLQPCNTGRRSRAPALCLWPPRGHVRRSPVDMAALPPGRRLSAAHTRPRRPSSKVAEPSKCEYIPANPTAGWTICHDKCFYLLGAAFGTRGLLLPRTAEETRTSQGTLLLLRFCRLGECLAPNSLLLCA